MSTQAVSYRGAKFISSTLKDHGENARTGQLRYFVDDVFGEREFILLKAAGTIADGLGIMKDTTSSAEVTVIVTSGTTVQGLGINNTGSSLVTGNYFWALRKGLGYGDPTAGGFSDGDKIGPAAAGEIAAVGTVGTVFGVAISDSSATVNANLVLFDFATGFVAAS